MGEVVAFRPRQYPPERGPEGFQPSGARVVVLVDRPDTTLADLILAGAEVAHAWSEAVLAHSAAVSLSVVRMSVGSCPTNTRTRCDQSASHGQADPELRAWVLNVLDYEDDPERALAVLANHMARKGT